MRICPSVSSSRVRGLVESAHKKCLVCDSSDDNTFLSTELDLDFISTSLASLGINRSTILQNVEVQTSLITNRAVDLDHFRSHEGLPKTLTTQLLARLYKAEQKPVQSALLSALKAYQSQRKSGTTNNIQLDAFLAQPFTVHKTSTPTPAATHPIIKHVSTQTLHSADEIVNLNKEITLLKSVIQDLQEEKAKSITALQN